MYLTAEPALFRMHDYAHYFLVSTSAAMRPRIAETAALIPRRIRFRSSGLYCRKGMRELKKGRKGGTEKEWMTAVTLVTRSEIGAVLVAMVGSEIQNEAIHMAL